MTKEYARDNSSNAEDHEGRSKLARRASLTQRRLRRFMSLPFCLALGAFPIRMACPLCGDRCTCSSANTGKVIAGSRVSVLVEPQRDSKNPDLSDLGAHANPQHSSTQRACGGDWRGEVANRVQAHRARRRRRYDPESSMSLTFPGTPAASDPAKQPTENGSNGRSEYQQGSNAPEFSDCEQAEEGRLDLEDMRPSPYRRIVVTPPAESIEDKVIQFPRSAEQDRLFDEELAEEISTTPRILDSPETAEEAPPLSRTVPPLANFHLDDFASAESAQWHEEAEDSQIELPLQVAAMGARTMSALTDAVVVMTAVGLFGVIVLSMAKFVPQGRVAVAIAVLLPLTLWAAYHYVFLVYAGRTPGMQLAQLELSSFEGCVPTRKIRGWRAVSMLLSCASVGLGFAWAAVDEDRLSWHDRITRTYLRQS
jgi:uncharacterized RDD family membrane protein YckC